MLCFERVHVIRLDHPDNLYLKINRLVTLTVSSKWLTQSWGITPGAKHCEGNFRVLPVPRWKRETYNNWVFCQTIYAKNWRRWKSASQIHELGVGKFWIMIFETSAVKFFDLSLLGNKSIHSMFLIYLA